MLGHFFRRLSHAYPTYDLDFEAKIGHLAYHLADFDNMVNAGPAGPVPLCQHRSCDGDGLLRRPGIARKRARLPRRAGRLRAGLVRLGAQLHNRKDTAMTITTPNGKPAPATVPEPVAAAATRDHGEAPPAVTRHRDGWRPEHPPGDATHDSRLRAGAQEPGRRDLRQPPVARW